MGLTKSSQYLFEKRGYFYFSRRVPSDLLGSYKTPRVVFSLKTKSLHIARSRANSLSSKLEEEWHTLRLINKESVLSRFLITRSNFDSTPSSAPKLTEAKKLYLDAKSEGKSKTFWQSADRCVGFVIDLLGDRPVDTYERSEVNQLRDAYIDKGLSRASIKRNLSTIRAIINFAARETGLTDVSAFSSIYLGEENKTTQKKRPAFPLGVIQTIQKECFAVNDEARWLIALVSDSGMRLSEAAGLLVEDIQIEADIPHLILRPHPWRRLKTTGSERHVPLVGASYQAAMLAVENAQTKFVFPRYCNETECKSNSASAALNKWISPRSPDGCVIHSFRHSMRDRLRAVECPPDIIDRIGGWTVSGVGESYGSGYPLRVLQKWLKRAVEGR